MCSLVCTYYHRYLLNKYLYNSGVIPDRELEIIMVNAFGNTSFAVNKLRRMAYWMPKFRNLSPFPLPNPVPMDTLELAKLAIQRITLPDLQTQIEVYKVGKSGYSIILPISSMVSKNLIPNEKILQGTLPLLIDWREFSHKVGKAH